MVIQNDFSTENELRYELTNGESLLWSGKPKTGILFRSSDMLMIPFSLFWCGFAFFWEFGVVSSGAPFFFMIWGIPFICVGLYVTIGRFFYDKLDRDKTLYGVTTERIIIKSGVFKTSVQSFNIKNLNNLSIEEKSDHSGTIKLDQGSNMPFSNFAIGGWPGTKKVPALEFIENVRDVYNMILQQQHK